MAVTGTDITITTRTAKGSALTHAELDANQTGLKSAIESHSHNEFAAALGADDNYMTDAEKTKLAGIATGAEVNVQADWDASTGDAAILNKPSIPSISGLLNEAAHDALDHTGLTGVPAAYSLPTASTTVLGGVKVDGTTVLISDGVISSTGGSGGGVTDHGLLTGLSDDDHSQYYNQTRGDARYSQTNHNHNLNDLTEKSYSSLTDKPSIPSITGLLNEAAHDLLDHTGLTGIPAAYSLPTASTTVLGGVKVDGTTVTISDGVISATGGSGMTNPMTAAGDIIIGGTDGAPARLPKGSDGQVLTLADGSPAWDDAPAGGGAGPTTYDVSTSTNELAISSLSGTWYRLLIRWIPAISGTSKLQLLINDKLTPSQYRTSQEYAGIDVSGSYGQSGGMVDNYIGYCATSGIPVTTIADVIVSGTDLHILANSVGVAGGGSRYRHDYAVRCTEAISSITTLTIKVDNGTLEPGSKITFEKQV